MVYGLVHSLYDGQQVGHHAVQLLASEFESLCKAVPDVPGRGRDDRKGLVELVGNAGRQFPQCDQARRLQELGLEVTRLQHLVELSNGLIQKQVLLLIAQEIAGAHCEVSPLLTADHERSFIQVFAIGLICAELIGSAVEISAHSLATCGRQSFGHQLPDARYGFFDRAGLRQT